MAMRSKTMPLPQSYELNVSVLWSERRSPPRSSGGGVDIVDSFVPAITESPRWPMQLSHREVWATERDPRGLAVSACVLSLERRDRCLEMKESECDRRYTR